MHVRFPVIALVLVAVAGCKGDKPAPAPPALLASCAMKLKDSCVEYSAALPDSAKSGCAVNDGVFTLGGAMPCARERLIGTCAHQAKEPGSPDYRMTHYYYWSDKDAQKDKAARDAMAGGMRAMCEMPMPPVSDAPGVWTPAPPQ